MSLAALLALGAALQAAAVSYELSAAKAKAFIVETLK